MLLWLYTDVCLSEAVLVAMCVSIFSPNWSEFILFFLPFSKEQRQKDMDEDRREEIQQLIRKSKNEQSEYHTLYGRCTVHMFSEHIVVNVL